MQLLIILLYNDETIYGLVCAQISVVKKKRPPMKYRAYNASLSNMIKGKTDSDLLLCPVFLEICSPTGHGVCLV